ncbi:MAG: hypothetical protein AAF750_12455 [Planctomycetota bacterium]
MIATRLLDHPIISPDTPGWDATTVGHNINGPSLIRAPDGLKEPIGQYYLYFAHHQGTSIRLATADALTGPWTIHTPGTLQLDQTPFTAHIASPDVHADPTGNHRLVMIYHGHGGVTPATGVEQPAALAVSDDGLHWQHTQVLPAESYLRAFHAAGRTLGVAKGGRLYEAPPSTFDFKPLRRSLDVSGRHWAVLPEGDRLHIAYSRWGDAPEHLLQFTLQHPDDLPLWNQAPRTPLLTAEHPWEGSEHPVRPSATSSVHEPVHELRDPDLFRDADGRTYLLYTVAGEAGIALAELSV